MANGEGMRRFHAYKSVATLKGRIVMRPCIVMRPAPIAVMHPAPTFSRLQKRGHIEGAHRDAPVHRDAPSAHRGDAPSAHVFTPTKAWPH